ncbi:MAG: UvrB/UvrC motif-containing protein [Ilumatobacteraceae bacterium]
MGTPPDLKDLEAQAGRRAGSQKKAVEEQRFEEAGRLRDQEKSLLEEKATKEAEVKASGVDLFDEVDEEAIAEVLSIWTGIPVYKLTEKRPNSSTWRPSCTSGSSARRTPSRPSARASAAPAPA